MKKCFLMMLCFVLLAVYSTEVLASSREQKQGIDYQWDPTLDDLFGVKRQDELGIGIAVIITKRIIHKPAKDGSFTVEYLTDKGLRIISEQCGDRKPSLVKVRKRAYAYFIGVIALTDEGPAFRVTDPDLTNCSKMIDLDDPSSNQLLGFLGKGKIMVTSKVRKKIVPEKSAREGVYNVEYVTKEGLHIYCGQCGPDPVTITPSKRSYFGFTGVATQQNDGKIVFHETEGNFSNCPKR